MNFRSLVIAGFVASSAFAAPVPKELKKSDNQRIQGLWVYDFYRDGDARGTGGRKTFGRDKMYHGTHQFPEHLGNPMGFALKPGPTPSQIDFLADNDGSPVWCGIYKFEGDALHIAYFHRCCERPEDYSLAPGKIVIVLKRPAEIR